MTQNNEGKESKDIAEERALVKQTEMDIQGLKVTSQAKLELANEYLKKVTEAEKRVLAREKERIDKLNQLKNQIWDDYLPLRTKLAYFKNYLKIQIRDYTDELDKIEAIKKAEIEKKVESGKMEVGKAAETLQKLEDKKSAVTIRHEKKVEIFNAELLPRAYLTPEISKINKAALAGLIGEKEGVRVVEVKNIIAKK